jgi:hypothetical protein
MTLEKNIIAGQIGGVSKSFLAIFSLLLLPFADHSFALKAISSLFVLK